MRFDDRMLTKVRYTVEIKVDRFSGKNRFSGQVSVEAGQQLRNLVRGNARGIFGQKAPLGHAVETAEQCESWVSHQRHDMALALNGPKLEGHRRAQRACSAG